MEIIIVEDGVDLSEFNRSRIKEMFDDVKTFFPKDKELILVVRVGASKLEASLNVNDEEEYYGRTFYYDIYFEEHKIVSDTLFRLYKELIEDFDIKKVKKVKVDNIKEYADSSFMILDEDENLQKVNNIIYGIETSNFGPLGLHKLEAAGKKQIKGYTTILRTLVCDDQRDDRAAANKRLHLSYDKISDLFYKNVRRNGLQSMYNLARKLYSQSVSDIYDVSVYTLEELESIVCNYESKFKMLLADMEKVLSHEIER